MWQPLPAAGPVGFGPQSFVQTATHTWVNEKQMLFQRIQRERNFAVVHQELYPFIKALFGIQADADPSETSYMAGYFHNLTIREDCDEMYNLLQFNGDFFQALLRLHRMDRRTFFKFPVRCLPAPSQRLLELLASYLQQVDPNNLPEVYSGKVQYEGHAPVCLHLSAVEFYLYSFAYTLVCRHPLLPAGEPSTLYMDLLQNYLECLIPPCSILPQLLDDYLQQVRAAVPHSPRTSEHRPYNEDARLATTFIDILVEMYMNQNKYDAHAVAGDGGQHARDGRSLLLHPGQLYAGSVSQVYRQERDYVHPTGDMIRGAHIVVVHMHKFLVAVGPEYDEDPQDYTGVGSPMQGLVYANERQGYLRGMVLDTGRIMSHIGVHVYRFLRLAFQFGPVDSSTRHLLALWLAFTQPWHYDDPMTVTWADLPDEISNQPLRPAWEHLNKDESGYHIDFITDYFPFYSCLFMDILKRILGMLKSERLGAANAYPLRLLAEVLTMYTPGADAPGSNELIDILKKVEEDYAMPRGYAVGQVALNSGSNLLRFEGDTVRYERIFTSPKSVPLFKHLYTEVERIVHQTQQEPGSNNRHPRRRNLSRPSLAVPHQSTKMERLAHGCYSAVQAVTGLGYDHGILASEDLLQRRNSKHVTHRTPWPAPRRPSTLLPYASTYGVAPQLRRAASHLTAHQVPQSQGPTWPGGPYLQALFISMLSGVSWVGSALSDTLFSYTDKEKGSRDDLHQLLDNLVRLLTAIGQYGIDASPTASRPASREGTPAPGDAVSLRSRTHIRHLVPRPYKSAAAIAVQEYQMFWPYENKLAVRAIYRVARYLNSKTGYDVFPVARYLGNYLTYLRLLLVYVFLIFVVACYHL